jgi:hypothetical protein
VWDGGALVGGMYGVAQGTLFCGESMFSRAVNASKTALLVFCQAFAQRGGRLIDCQVLNEHTASLAPLKSRDASIEHWMPAVRKSSRATSGYRERSLCPMPKCFPHIFCEGVIITPQSSFCLLPRRRLGPSLQITS